MVDSSSWDDVISYNSTQKMTPSIPSGYVYACRQIASLPNFSTLLLVSTKTVYISTADKYKLVADAQQPLPKSPVTNRTSTHNNDGKERQKDRPSIITIDHVCALFTTELNTTITIKKKELWSAVAIYSYQYSVYKNPIHFNKE